MWSGYEGHMGWMGIWWIVGLAALLVFVWILAKAAGGSNPPAGESPEAILKRRYASGDIDRDEYERRLADLRR